MPLAKQLVKMPITAGFNTYSDPKQANKPYYSQDFEVERNGEIRSRRGWQKVSTSKVVTANGTGRNAAAALSAGYRLFAQDGKPVVIGADKFETTANGMTSGDIAAGQGVFGLSTSATDSAWTALGGFLNAECANSRRIQN